MSEFLKQTCSTNIGNPGAQQCTGTPGRNDKIWLVPIGTKYTKAEALLEATWDTLFNSAKGSRGYPLPAIFKATFDQSDDVYETGWSNKQDFASEGLDKDTYMLDKVSLYVAKQLRTFNGNSFAAYIVSDTGKIKGWSDDGIYFKPFTILNYRFGKRQPENGEQLERPKLTIVWKYPAEWNDNPAVIEPTWNANEIDAIKDLYVTVSTSTPPTTSEVTIELLGFDSVPHEDAVVGDFIILDSTGVEVTVSNRTEVSAGIYLLAASLPTGDYTVGLQNPEDATTKYFATPTLASFAT